MSFAKVKLEHALIYVSELPHLPCLALTTTIIAVGGVAPAFTPSRRDEVPVTPSLSSFVSGDQSDNPVALFERYTTSCQGR